MGVRVTKASGSSPADYLRTGPERGGDRGGGGQLLAAQHLLNLQCSAVEVTLAPSGFECRPDLGQAQPSSVGGGGGAAQDRHGVAVVEIAEALSRLARGCGCPGSGHMRSFRSVGPTAATDQSSIAHECLCSSERCFLSHWPAACQIRAKPSRDDVCKALHVAARKATSADTWLNPLRQSQRR